jgi:DNA-binding CsgD family transcriptional regulator
VISDERYSGLLDSLYSAPGDDQGWQQFLDALVGLVKAQTAVLLAFDQRHSSYSVNASVGVSPEANGLYNRHYGRMDPWFLGGRKVFRPNLVFDGRELCPAEEFAQSEFYNDFFRPHCENSFHECGAVLEMPADQASPPSLVSLLRDRRKQPFQQQDLDLLGRLLPHLQRGLALHRRIVDLRLQHSSQSWALDQVGFGIVLLHADGKVLFANKAADEMCNRSRGLELAIDGLRAIGARDNQTLQRMIQAAAHGVDGAAPVTVRIVANTPGDCLTVCVTRSQAADFLNVARDSIVAIFISDPARVPVPRPQMLSSLFGLTPAEARLAVLMIQGHTLRESAEHVGVTFATVRSQLIQIFQKTGTSRQSQLISLLMRLPACDHEDYENRLRAGLGGD